MRLLSILAAVAALGVCGFAFLAATFWGLTMKCGDSCSTVGGWRHDPEAWQWEGIAVTGAVALVAGAALLLFVLLRRSILAAVAAAIAGVAVTVVAVAL